MLPDGAAQGPSADAVNDHEVPTAGGGGAVESLDEAVGATDAEGGEVGRALAAVWEAILAGEGDATLIREALGKNFSVPRPGKDAEFTLE